MKFLYTGASSYNTPQTTAFKSLGGFISSTQLPNDLSNNIFSDISELSKQHLRREAICIALYNDDVDVAQNLELTFNADFAKLIADFQIAFSGASIDDCGNYYFESINDSSAIPYLEFDTITDLNKVFNIGNVQPKAYIGVWLIRKLTKTKTIPISCDTLASNYTNNVEATTEESFTLDLAWQDDNSNSI